MQFLDHPGVNATKFSLSSLIILCQSSRVYVSWKPLLLVLLVYTKCMLSHMKNGTLELTPTLHMNNRLGFRGLQSSSTITFALRISDEGKKFITLEPEGQWEIGPDKYKSQDSDGDCIVQVPLEIPTNIYIIIAWKLTNQFVIFLFILHVPSQTHVY